MDSAGFCVLEDDPQIIHLALPLCQSSAIYIKSVVQLSDADLLYAKSRYPSSAREVGQTIRANLFVDNRHKNAHCSLVPRRSQRAYGPTFKYILLETRPVYFARPNIRGIQDGLDEIRRKMANDSQDVPFAIKRTSCSYICSLPSLGEQTDVERSVGYPR
jgi:hypothetical protein